MDWIALLVLMLLKNSQTIADLFRGFFVFSIVYWAIGLLVWFYWFGGKELLKKKGEEDGGEVSW